MSKGGLDRLAGVTLLLLLLLALPLLLPLLVLALTRVFLSLLLHSSDSCSTISWLCQSRANPQTLGASSSSLILLLLPL